MSDATPLKAGPVVGVTVQEVQGIFSSDEALQDAIARLTQAGFDRADLSLPEARPASQTATPDQGASLPTTDTDVRQVRTMATSMAGTVGAFAAAGAVIATGGLAAVAIGAAAAVGGGAALLANSVGNAADNVQHEGREQSAARGELVLSVRAIDAARQASAVDMMRASGATEVTALERTNADVSSLPSPR